MDLNALSNQIERNVVESEFGWGDDITYTPRATGVGITTRAFCSPGDFRKAEEVKNVETVIRDKASFLSVFLDTPPAINDKITDSDGAEWSVKDHIGNNPYDIYAEANTRHAGSRVLRTDR